MVELRSYFQAFSSQSPYVNTRNWTQHTGPPYSFHRCTLFHDDDPFVAHNIVSRDSALILWQQCRSHNKHLFLTEQFLVVLLPLNGKKKGCSACDFAHMSFCMLLLPLAFLPHHSWHCVHHMIKFLHLLHCHNYIPSHKYHYIKSLATVHIAT